MREVARAKKKREECELAKRKLESARRAAEKKEQLLPICKEHVEKGLEHVLALNVGQKVDILRYIFEHPEAKSNLRKPRADRLLRDAMRSDPPLNEGELVDPMKAELSEIMEAMLAKVESRAASHEFMTSTLFVPQAEGDATFFQYWWWKGKLCLGGIMTQMKLEWR